MSKNQVIYVGSQEDLYAAAAIGWQGCTDHLSRFHTFNAQYTAAFIDTAKLAIAAAKALPNEDARQAQLTNQRAILLEAAGESTGVWQDLYVYINRTFNKTQLASMRKMAGGEYYAVAANRNWKAMDTMLQMASDFLVKYGDDLIAANMPAAFEADFNAKKTAFETAFTIYSNTKTGIQNDTDAKTAANNAVYTSVATMLQDAKAIFRKDSKTKSMFTYVYLLKIVRKKGKSGFRIVVKEQSTMLPISNATLVLQPGNITAFVNADGIAEVHVPKNNIYNAAITTPGYQPVELKDMQPETGVMQRVEVLVQKSAAAA